MATFVDEAIVLRRVDYGEADRILTLLTRDHGKVGVIARGVRKAGSRLASHTDLLARSQVQLARGRGQLLVLTQARRLGSAQLREDPVRLACAAVCCEITDRVIEEQEPDAAVYLALAAALERMTVSDRDPPAQLVWFAQSLIHHLGYGPRLTRCAACSSELPEAPAGFSARAGGLLCAICAALDPDSIPTSVRLIKVLRVIAAGDEDTFVRLRLEPKDLTTLESIVEHELAIHLERRLKSLEVLRSLRAPA